jgi:Bacterial transcriptional activator domain/Berberine and berberine like
VYRAERVTGRTDLAVVALVKMLTVDPFNESVHRALIRLHADSGDRAGAISVYHRLATLLERELGVAPASTTTALVTELLGDTGRLGTLSTRDALDIAEPDPVGPTSAGGAYVNFLMDEGPDRVKASYRDNYARLTQIMRRYDPHNVFHVNQNIRSSD